MPRGIYARTPAHRQKLRDLRQHLEAQFRDGMSWESGGFHVDHIKPVAAFIREGVTNPAVIHALDNLQVLTPRENLTKSDKFPLLQVPA